MSREFETHIVKVSAQEVAQYYAKDFKPSKGRKLIEYMPIEWFYDPAKGVFIFHMTTEAVPPK